MSAPVPSRPSEVKAWCIANGFHPNRTLGQNFLIDRNTIDGIVAATGAGPGMRVLEIGPGLGALTHSLVASGADVVAVEKDARLGALLREALADAPNFHLHIADALDIDLPAFLAQEKSGGQPGQRESGASPAFDILVSNLPYSVGTRILLEICRSPLAPRTCVVMVQREVADRIAAAPSTPDRGQAGVWIQQAYDVAALRTVPPTCFWPRPEIASTVLRLVRHDRLPLSPLRRLDFERISKAAFLHRRKQMLGIFRNLSAVTGLVGDEAISAWLASAGLSPQVRPDAISNEEWRALALALPESPSTETTPDTP